MHDDIEFDEYVNEETEIEIDDDYNPSELDDGFVWHPAAQDGYSMDFA